MREITPNAKRPRERWVRSADGRVEPVRSGRIGDTWTELRRARLIGAGQDQKRTRHQAKGKGFRLKFTLPKVRLPKRLPRPRLPRVGRRRLLVGLIIPCVLLSAAGILYSRVSRGGPGQPAHTTVGAHKVERPDFPTVLPKGRDVDGLGGWARVSPPGKEPVFAFVDTLGKARITVSEQPLPEGFKKNVAASVADLAKQFTANETVDVNGATAYIGTSIRGPQSVIFATPDLLLLIKSNIKVTNEEWASYLESLQ